MKLTKTVRVTFSTEEVARALQLFHAKHPVVGAMPLLAQASGGLPEAIFPVRIASYGDGVTLFWDLPEEIEMSEQDTNLHS